MAGRSSWVGGWISFTLTSPFSGYAGYILVYSSYLTANKVGIRKTLKTAKLEPFRAVSHSSQHSPPCAGSNKGAIWVPGSRNGSPSELVGPVRRLYLSYFPILMGLFVPVQRLYRYDSRDFLYLYIDCTYPVRLPVRFSDTLYLYADYTRLSVLPVQNVALFVPVHLLYRSIFSRAFRTCISVVK